MELKDKKMRIHEILILSVFICVLAIFVIFAVFGNDIHERSLPVVDEVRAKPVYVDDIQYRILPKSCYADGKVYTLYKQKNFFGTNVRVEAVEVETEEFCEDNRFGILVDDVNCWYGLDYNAYGYDHYIVIVSGFDPLFNPSYVNIPEEGLYDGESVLVSGEYNGWGAD